MRLFGLPILPIAPIAGAVIVAGGLALTKGSDGPSEHRFSSLSFAVPAAQKPIEIAAQTRPDRAVEILDSGPRHKAVRVADGDTLLDILIRAGVDRNDATSALAAMRRVYDPRTLKVGQRIDVDLGPAANKDAARPLEAIALASEPGRHVVTTRAGDSYAAAANRLPEIRETAHVAGAIKSSLFESATAQGMPPQVLAALIAAYSYDVDFQRDLQPGDTFEVLYQRTKDSEGDVVRPGELQFADLILSGKHFPIYRYTDMTGQTDFYNAKGESVRKALLRTPVDGARITSRFGMRVNPILGFSMMHKGVDFGVPIGTPILAAGSGAVEMAGTNGAYGLYVRLKHDGIHSTAYAHMSALAKGMRVGRKVKQGDVIGYVGESGRATGPHLHYEVLVNNQQVNPMSVKFKSGNVLAGRELLRFKAVTAEMETRLAATPVATQLALAHRAE